MSYAQNYPVTQKYGYDPTYPLNNGFHKGTDYACPDNTPVAVNGVIIGYSGHTGSACWGAHVHVGRFNTAGENLDSTGRGWSFNSARVVAVSSDAVNGNWIRIYGDGDYYVFLHLSKQTCVVGQVLKGASVVKQASAPAKPVDGDMILITNSDNEYARWNKLFMEIRGRNASREEFVNAAVGRTWLQAIEILSDDTEADNAMRSQEIGQLAQRDDWAGQIHTLDAQVKQEQTEEDALKATIAAFKPVYERFEKPIAVRTKQKANVYDLNFNTLADAEEHHILTTIEAHREFTAVGKASRLDLAEQPVFYMSNESFGDADKTGIPAYAQGVKSTDLEPAPANTETAETVTPVSAAAHESSTPVDDTAGEKIPVTVKEHNPEAWKSTFKLNNSGDYKALQSVVVHDLEGKLADVQLVKGTVKKIAGDFIGHDGVEYWRTELSASHNDSHLRPKNEDWRGIPKIVDGKPVLEEDDSVFDFHFISDKLEDIKDDLSRRTRKALDKGNSVSSKPSSNWLAGRLKRKA